MSGIGDVENSEMAFEAFATFLDGSQSFDPYAPEWAGMSEDVQSIGPPAADWLIAFVNVDADLEGDAALADKPKVNYIVDEVITTGTRGGTGMDALSLMAIMDAAEATFLANLNAALNVAVDTRGPDDDQVIDEVIVVGARQDPPDIFIIRGPVGSGTFTYHFDGQNFDNESDWLNAMRDWILEDFANRTPFSLDDTEVSIPLTPLNLDLWEVQSNSVRRAIIEFLCGCNLPTAR